MIRFFIETYHEILWFARRQAEARKVVKYVLFAKAEQKLEKIIETMPFEQQREHFGGQSLAFSWKNQCFYSSSITENLYSMCFAQSAALQGESAQPWSTGEAKHLAQHGASSDP